LSCARSVCEFGEVIDNLLILLSALKRAFPLLKRVQCGLERLDGFRLSGFCRFCLLQFLGYLFGVGAVAAYAPMLRHQAISRTIIGRTSAILLLLAFVFFVVNQRAGVVLGVDLFL
jgi:hypothetical protein